MATKEQERRFLERMLDGSCLVRRNAKGRKAKALASPSQVLKWWYAIPRTITMAEGKEVVREWAARKGVTLG